MDHVRDAIEGTTRNVHDLRWRIQVKRQGDLWDEGVKAGMVLKDAQAEEPDEEDAEQEEETVANGGYLNGCESARAG